MRYRINKYSATIGTNDLTLNVYVSQSVYDMLTIDEQYYLDAASLRKLTEAVRLIADETQGGYVIMSTGQKNVLSGAKAIHLGNWYILRMYFQKSALIDAADGDDDDIAAINAMANSDQFTIEMDWGDEPSGLSGGDDAMGGLIAHDCGRAIITCDYNPYVTGSDGMLISGLSVNMPDGFGVGSVVKAESLIAGCKVPQSVSSPSLSYNGSGYYVSGVTEWITLEKGKAYRCTGKVAMGSSSSYVYTYEEIGTAGASGREIKDEVDDIKDFFGIVKDGDTVKVVTEDGGEEVVVPVGLMDEDDVYDYLEDIAVLMGGITAQQAASITAATRAIIHGGSGSGSGE